MAKDGRLPSPLYVQFVMGVKNAMPVDRPVFDFYIETLKRLAPDAEWCGAGIGPNQIVLNEWCVAAGGHARTGLEDNLRLDRDTLAPSNAALVRRVVELCEKYERPVATPLRRGRSSVWRRWSRHEKEGLRERRRGARRPALRRHDHRRRRLRPLRHPRAADRGHPRQRRQGPNRRLEQRRRRRLRPRRAAADAAGEEDDLLLRRRERRVHAPVSLAASSSSSSTRRARSPSGCGPAAPASRASTPGPASAR